MKLTKEQMQDGYDAWRRAVLLLPMFDDAARAALYAAAKADIESGGDINAIRAALEAVEVES